jgi:NAD-dependent SIR2 family protein deacetylase
MPETTPTTPIPQQIEQGIERLSTLLGRGPVAVLSGAGLSTASGIPAYRNRHGQWRHPQPIQHQDFLRSESVRQRYWARSFAGWPRMDLAGPAPGHRALAQMQQDGIISMVVTQNVDGLHRKAGSRSVIELHGRIDRVICLTCGQHFPRASVQHWLATANPDYTAVAARAAPDGDADLPAAAAAAFRIPGCPSCKGTLKPDVVFFGDSVPRERVAAAKQSIDAARALLVVGSSLMVYSGFRLVEHARQRGLLVVAINQGVTRADHLLDSKIEADCGDVLERLLDILELGK